MLKKTLIIVFCLFFIITFYFYTKTPVFNKYSDEYSLYYDNSSANSFCKKVDRRGYLFEFSVKGESVVINKSVDVDKILNDFNARLIFIENSEEETSYYAYSDKIKYFEIIKGKKVNLQLSINEKNAVLGCPIIYGSF